MKKLKDLDEMPFGMHKGTAMANVPDQYLIWFWGENCTQLREGKLYGDQLMVMLYIEDCFDDLP